MFTYFEPVYVAEDLCGDANVKLRCLGSSLDGNPHDKIFHNLDTEHITMERKQADYIELIYFT
jgi:predicted AlkP superfamily pyrophosphatase or phosphodiesterase